MSDVLMMAFVLNLIWRQIGEVTSGAFINHPDVDLANPELNTSGIPWYTLYYKDNYLRLQQIKAHWDPRNIFHHALPICPT